jgi:aldose sugar dehydrogenase
VGKYLALAAASTLFAACSFVPGSASEAEAEASAESQQRRQVVAAARLWEANCARCHGDAGQGGGAGTSTLLTEELFDQNHDRPFFDAIKQGLPDRGMEAFGEVLADEDIWALVVHIRELQASALRRAGVGAPRPVDGVYRSQRASFRVETVVPERQGLEIPWAVAWLPDGRMLVTNRPGTMQVLAEGKLTTVEGMPPVVHNGQGGLMDVAVHPDYARNGWVYLGLNDPHPGGDPRSGMTKIVRGKLEVEGERVRWTSQETIFETAPEHYSTSGAHFGTRIVFDGNGHLFFSIGDRGPMQHAQSLSRPNGKMYRLKDDGTVPVDNPFVGREDAIAAIWSYGHRNPQGIVFGEDGGLWITEHAPRGGDELNLVRKGANYGWPSVSFGINYNNTPFRTPWPASGQDFVQPVYRWIPSTGVCGLSVASGPAFAGWKGDLFAGGLSGQNVDRIRIREGQIVEREEILFGLGRVRDVKTAPDGTIYVVLNGPDKIVRLVPAP